MIATRIFLFLVLALCDYGLCKKGKQTKSHYPAALQNRYFVSNEGLDFIFGKDFSPIFGFVMFRSIEQTKDFFTEYYVNSTDFKIYYSCKKYEVYDEFTVFLWAFELQLRLYSDPVPSMCDICIGNIVRTIRITDTISGKPNKGDFYYNK
ncbi:uncharacterized protein LOC134695964 [Mytilus trossulus]|uniref:uncharacterized protein LOC134695964 n=1 Tax=Mytilus trossulus TaxID=6551 RepID=UPI003006F0D7